jgi:hypothetical protein
MRSKYLSINEKFWMIFLSIVGAAIVGSFAILLIKVIWRFILR